MSDFGYTDQEIESMARKVGLPPERVRLAYETAAADMGLAHGFTPGCQCLSCKRKRAQWAEVNAALDMNDNTAFRAAWDRWAEEVVPGADPS